MYEGELIQRGQWVVGCIDGPIAWPTAKQTASFRGHKVHIIPVTKELYPAVALRCPPGLSRRDAERVLSRFLSALSWMTEQGVSVVDWVGGDLPRSMGRERSHRSLRHLFDFANLPDATDPRFELALALLREARFINHPAYAFLSAFRVFETHLNGRKAMVDWINANTGSIDGFRSERALKKLVASQPDVGAYLYESGRCAVAHANRHPVVNPDEPEELRRLGEELPLIIELATRLIEAEFGIETGRTIYRKHLYELSGFKRLFGDQIVAQILAGTVPDQNVEIPHIDVGLSGHEPFPALCRLSPTSLIVKDGLVQMTLESEERPVAIRFRLNFPEERLEFEIESDFFCSDAGSADGAEHVAQALKFKYEYYANGRLQLTDHDTGDVLARKDEFIPVNVFVDHKGALAEVQKWLDEAASRRMREAGDLPGP